VFCGFYELLVIGGYVSGKDKALVPFLGSSLASFDLDDEVTSDIYITTTPLLHLSILNGYCNNT
jgi:hypothetical protein